MIVGTAVRITSITNIQGDAGRIVIYNPDKTEKVPSTAMTDIGGLTYEYIFQSSNGDQTGKYTTVIEVDSGIYTAKTIVNFVLNDKFKC